MKIKFCGLRTAADIAAVNEVKPDYAGFILSPKFWRYVNPHDLKRLKEALDPRIKAVGVFVDNPINEVIKYLSEGLIDIAQLHGSEDDSYITEVRSQTAKPVIKAFKINFEGDVKCAEKSTADYVLLDSGTGTGQQFDWSLIQNFGRDFFLAGGLCPENAAEAVIKAQPYALDVSSGIETDRVKDIKKMRRFKQAVLSVSDLREL